MSAKHGLTGSFRLIGCLAAVAMLFAATFTSVASAKTPLKPTAYVALGDSLSFGYKAATFNANKAAHKTACEAAATAAGKGEAALAQIEGAKCEPQAFFEPGFVGEFGAKLAKTEKTAGNALATVNLGCPGETSDGLIGHNEAFGGGPGPEYNPCAYHDLAGYPLKTAIGSSSELEAAAGLIESKNDGEVTAVSLQIGSNDELQVVGKCENPKYLAEHSFPSIVACIGHEAGPEGFAFSGGVFAHILNNIGASIKVIRGAGYTGTVLLIGFYNPDATILAGSDGLDKVLNESLEATVAGNVYGEGVKVAQPFPKFNPEAPLYKEGETSKEKEKLEKKENKAICKYTEMCPGGVFPSLAGDIHPTAAGYAAIAKIMTAAF
jgi:lysophospholipase L1-like esterase